MKKILLVCTLFTATFFSCTNCDECLTEEKCREKFPCPETSSGDLSAAKLSPSVCLDTISSDTAMAWINNFKNSATGLRWGICLETCAIKEVLNASGANEICFNFGYKHANNPNTFVTVMKWINSMAADSGYAAIKATSAGEPTCPPGTRCN